jgi:mRNA interferase RelE/StbE
VTYRVCIKRSAAKALEAIARKDRLRLMEAVDRLAENPDVGSVLKGGLSGLRRLRIGRYRIVYEVDADQLVVLVVRTAHRRDAYR